MKQQFTSRNRKAIRAKMASVFKEQIKSLPTEYRIVLLEDLVTAFENRFMVLKRVNMDTEFSMGIVKAVELETP